jgi:NodT family efflux transporter outer membrane factor (OMF) lipoprotein
MKTPLVLALCLGVAGCATVGGDYQRPALQTQTAWSVALPKGQEVAADAFWSGFGDAVLPSLIERALAANRGLQEAAARVREARALAVLAGSRNQPQLTVGGAIQSDRASETSRFPLTGLNNPVSLYQGGFDARWELDLFGGLRREREAAEADLAAAGLHREALAVSLAAEVASSYFDLRAAQALQQTLVHEIEAAREAGKLVAARVKAGLNPDIDARRAEDEVSRIEARLPAAQADAGLAMRRLGILLGAQSDSLLAELTPMQVLPERTPVLPETLPAGLLDRRPDLAAAEAELRAAQARIGSAEAAKLPSVGLMASFGLLSMTTGKLFNAASRQWNAGPQISLPLLDGGARDAAVEAARAQRDARLARWNQLAAESVAEVESAALRRQEADLRQAALARGLSMQREIVELARLRYERGLTDLTLPLDAVRQLMASESGEIAARAQRLKQTVALYKALGGGWSGARQ